MAKPYFVEIAGSTVPGVSAKGRCGDFGSEVKARKTAATIAASGLIAKVWRRPSCPKCPMVLVAEYGGRAA